MTTKQYDAYSDLITFTRGSSGTALRPVGYGAELVTNGTFDTDLNGWTYDSDWAWSAGKAVDSGTNAHALSQTIPTVAGRVYQVTFTQSDISNGSPSVTFDGQVVTASQSNAGTYTKAIVATGTSSLLFFNGQNALWSVDNVSVKEVIFDRAGDPLTLFNHPTNVPRIEYDASGNRKGLLIEEARTNLLHYSSELDNAYWSAASSRTEVIPNQITAPDGTLTADLVRAITGSATGEQYVRKFFGTLSGAYTTSAFVKKANWRYIVIRAGNNICIFDIDTATFTLATNNTVSVQDFGDGWYRISATQITDGTNNIFPSIGVADSATTFAWTTAPANNEGVYVWGMQYEQASFPTSYIPTSGSTATRSADVASIPTSAFGYNQKAGTVVVDFETQFGTPVGFPRILEIGNTSTGINRVNVYITASAGTVLGAVFSNTVLSCNINTGTQTSPASGKFAFAFADDDFAAVIDGGSVGTDTSGSFTTPSIPRDTLKFGGGATNANDNMSGHIKSIQYYPRRLTNAQLQELTS